VKPKSVVNALHQRCGDTTEHRADPFDGGCTHLFALGLRINPEAGVSGTEENLECVHAANVARDWHNGDYSSPPSGRRGICSVVAYDDGRTAAGSFASSRWLEIDESDLTA
jgi:hypothetical protein